MKIAALADLSKRWHIVLRCTICGPLGLLFIVLSHNQQLIFHLYIYEDKQCKNEIIDSLHENFYTPLAHRQILIAHYILLGNFY